MSVYKLDYAEYRDDGTITIRGNPDGYPQITGVVPAPDISYSPDGREIWHNGAKDNLILRGYLIVSWRLINNEAFDGPEQKTTLEVTYRPCQNKKEMAQVSESIKRILRDRRSQKTPVEARA